MIEILPQFDKNAAFIWACYGVSAAVLLLTGLWVWITARGARRALQRAQELSDAASGEQSQ